MLQNFHLEKLIGCLLSMVVSLDAATSEQQRFIATGDKFELNGKPFIVRSGELHASRIPTAYWQHRLRMAKALGLNTVSTYVFWNQHESEPGKFDWTGQNNIAEFCRLAHAEGLKVIIRPGPYVCGEWDFGGLPWWLLKDREMRVRTASPAFFNPAKRYLKALGEQLAPLQVTRGGPIIMVQVENEYDGYGGDSKYIEALFSALREFGFNVPLFTAEMTWTLRPSNIPGLIRSVGFSDKPDEHFVKLRRVQPNGPLFCGELYTGWFDIWGRGSSSGSGYEMLTNTLNRVLLRGASFNLYMAHGGTSFGFASGANEPPFRPQPTSYDYGAPIDEAGRDTPKFHAVRDLIAKHLQGKETLPPIPPRNPIIAMPAVALWETAPLLRNLPTPRKEGRPLPMEAMGQGHGCVLYRTKLEAGPAEELIVTDVRDFAIVLIDGKQVGTLDRMRRQRSIWLPARKEDATLDLLVEAFGHVHFGPKMGDRKGITERVEIGEAGQTRELLNWEIFQLPLNSTSLAALKFGRGQSTGPAFYRAKFDLKEVGDTFLDMRGWSKGMVWVNGRNLGRYWNIGPQQTLYLPGPWLTQRSNEIVVLDLLGTDKLEISGLAEPILNDVNLAVAGRIHRKRGQQLVLDGVMPKTNGMFSPGTGWQRANFSPIRARYLCLEARSSLANDGYTTCAELDVIDKAGRTIPRSEWKILYADSEEVQSEDSSADRIFDGRPETFWHTRWHGTKDPFPHQIVIDLGAERDVTGLTYLPRQDQANGRIGEYRIYTSLQPFPGL